MKTKFLSIRKKITHIFHTLFGQVKWISPPWLLLLQYQARRSPKLFWTGSVLLLALLASGAYTAYWYAHLPKPITTRASITVPDVTPNEETLVPNNLILNFGIQQQEFTPQSVAPLSLIGKTITQGIEISPHMKGSWVWNSDSQLMFTPSEDWPAGQKYTIKCASDFFAKQVNLDSHRFTFTTKPFQAQIKTFTLYQDPVHADIRHAVATIEFNYPVCGLRALPLS